MTETTEKNTSGSNDQFAELEIDTIMQALAHESASFKNLAGIARVLIDYTEFLKAQVTSLTKERDELKDILKDEESSALIWYEAMGQTLEQNDNLRSQLSNGDKEIKELKLGRPIEDAPTDGTPVLAWKTGSSFQPAVQHCEDGVWGRLTSAMGFEQSREQPDRFIYLPVTTPGKLASWRPDLLQSKEGEE